MGHKLTFNGIDTSDYGIIISGAGTYATPERDVLSMSVPGRNGDLHYDNGRYNNIQVTYQCGISKGFETNFLPFMRKMLSAPIYSRLEDDYHTDCYRLGTFRSELVPDVGTILRSGHFDMVFDCKPQRFLKAGENEIELNYTTNPQGNLTYDDYSDLSSTAKANADVFDLDGHKFYKFTLANDEQFLYVKRPDFYNRWLYPNEDAYGIYDKYLNAYSGSTFYYADVSPFTEVYGSSGLIDTPCYYGTNIYNPTQFESHPIIKIYFDPAYIGYTSRWVFAYFGSDPDNFVLYNSDRVNSGAYSFTDSVTMIDCDTLDAYANDINGVDVVNLNEGAMFTGQINLKPGNNLFKISADPATFDHVEKITLVPRWWTL